MSVTTTAPRIQIRFPGKRATDQRIAVTLEEPATPFPVTLYFVRVIDTERPGAVALINVGFELGRRFDLDVDGAIDLGERLPRPLDRRAVEEVVSRFRAYVEYARGAIELQTLGQAPGSRPSRRRRELTHDFLSVIAEQYEAWSTGTGHAVTEIAKAHGVNRSTASRWVKAAKALDAPIEELGLPVKAFNLLKRIGLDTVGNLIERSKADLAAVPNFTPIRIAEIESALAERGLSLRDGRLVREAGKKGG